MRWIVLALLLQVIAIWFSSGSSTGLASKVAFIAPTLVLIALVFHWLWKRVVFRLAGESEPPIRVNSQASSRTDESRHQAQPSSRPKPDLHPVWGLAAPSKGFVRPVFVAVAVGACIGAVATLLLLGRPFSESSISNKSAASATPANSTIPAQAEAAKPQSLSVEPKTVQTEAVKSQSFSADPETVQTEAVKSQSFSAGPGVEASSPTTSSDNPDPKRAEAQMPTQIPTRGQSFYDQLRCDVSLCERYYQSFRASDCTEVAPDCQRGFRRQGICLDTLCGEARPGARSGGLISRNPPAKPPKSRFAAPNHLIFRPGPPLAAATLTTR
jgi:hypothetical protein